MGNAHDLKNAYDLFLRQKLTLLGATKDISGVGLARERALTEASSVIHDIDQSRARSSVMTAHCHRQAF